MFWHLAGETACPAEQHSRNQNWACRSKESGARSQNRARVAVQQAADVVQRGQEFIRLTISKVMRKHQVVSAFLHGTLGDVSRNGRPILNAILLAHRLTVQQINAVAA